VKYARFILRAGEMYASRHYVDDGVIERL
jgi:hypothetical protein